MFNPAKAANEIKKEYMGYISSTFHFRNTSIQEKLKSELDKIVSNGPYVEVKDTFESGKSIRQLIDDGVLSPLFYNIEKEISDDKRKLKIFRSLYLHQEKAIRKITAGRNIVVTTGTGSGKTHCFLIPVINELLREEECGTLDDGVRAIFIYPMNALANDQIKELRAILMNYPQIRFGVYNGGTEHKEDDAIKLYEAMYENEEVEKLKRRLDNEVLSREEMKKHPPHILFTNYAMLEHLLFRPGDDVLFSKSKFKFVVLDEAHVYAGAVGIETALLMGRLKARLGDSHPQFILTSATLGDQTNESNKKIIDFARNLTGCVFEKDDIIYAYRKNRIQYSEVYSYPESLYQDLTKQEKPIEEILKEYKVHYNENAKEKEILYDLISTSDLYSAMQDFGDVILLDDFAARLHISNSTAVSFVALCAKAEKQGKLLDIRYHYFLRALDGGYMALNYPQSFSLTRKENYEQKSKMFEIGVCDDCGELAIIGKEDKNKKQLVRAEISDEREFYQIVKDNNDEEFEDSSEDALDNRDKEKEQFVLCATCGAIVPANTAHNHWCTCGKRTPILIQKVSKMKCLNCNGNIRRLQLGYEAATGVLATALFEQIPEYNVSFDDVSENSSHSRGLFAPILKKNRRKEKTGSQFLVFSDSRQGAAKFSCYMTDSYKEFLRRRGLWNIANQEYKKYPYGLTVSELVSLLDNYYSTHRLFRESNAANAISNSVDNRRNAWIAVLNELYNCSRDTSLVSFGKLQFSYLGNNDDVVDIVVDNYKVDKESTCAFLNYLAFEIVRFGAIVTDNKADINDDDRKYIYYTQEQQVVTKERDKTLKNAHSYLPTQYTNKNGEKKYYRQNKMDVIKDFLRVDDKGADDFLKEYWEYLTTKGNGNPYCLQTVDGKGYFMRAGSIKVQIGPNANLWKCTKCQKVTQFNIDNKCRHPHCGGKLEKLDSDKQCKNNYYAKLYESDKMAPLFIKEHTAQLAKKEALEYQQMFVRKEINALSCSTTFEMGVNVGDLETVFLRNIPPLSSNYAQRVGRAGRSINAAAFALTYARLSSHDFTFFNRPKEMIKGTIYPPQFKLENEKIIKRHIYAVAISLYLKMHSELYDRNSADAFINQKGYEGFLMWVKSKPNELKQLLKKSLPYQLWNLSGIEIDEFGWLEDFCGEHGKFTTLLQEYEKNIKYLEKEQSKALKEKDTDTAVKFKNKLDRYKKNELIDFLVRGNILPKYGFPVDSVELKQNIASKELKSLNLNRDLSVAIAEYAPSAEVVADGWLYTSRYISKPIVNNNEQTNFDISYIAKCPKCEHINYSKMPIRKEGKKCAICENILYPIDFSESIEPRSGFIAEQNVEKVPLTSQERKYKTEAIYIGDENAVPNNEYSYMFGNVNIKVQSTANDSLLVKSIGGFYVCSKCGYAIASDEKSKLNKFADYSEKVRRIHGGERHQNPFGKGTCSNTELKYYTLHHEFKTDVAKIAFETDTSDYATMQSVTYAILNAFADVLSIEKRDIKACLKYRLVNGQYEHQIIIYDAVPGGAGHSRRLVTENGEVLRSVIDRAISILSDCDCEPSCYKCLRSYENQKIHDILDRKKALAFLEELIK